MEKIINSLLFTSTAVTINFYKKSVSRQNSFIQIVKSRRSHFYNKYEQKVTISFDMIGEKILFLLALGVSIISFIHFYYTQQILADYDAIARLNIARKIIDSITPGFGQLGGIWLPFPQILMLPFIMNNFMWHYGLAGSLISMSSFIISSVFLYKTAFLITKQRFTSFIVWFVYVSNINILLLQTMAMSESFFLFSLIMTLYFLTLWTIKHDLLSLLFTGMSIILITLTRYEGYFIFLGAFLTVVTTCLINFLKDHNFRKAEGIVILFGTIASYGIVLWCIYSTLFYKDPIYWLHLYNGPKGQIITTVLTNGGVIHPQAKQVWQSFITYSEVMVWMNGILNTIAALCGLVLIITTIVKEIQQKGSYIRFFPILFSGIVLYLFLIYGYQKNIIPDIEFPQITLNSLLHKSFNYFSHSNIRYGIVMAPLLALYIGFFASRKKLFAILALLIVTIQIVTNFYSPLFLLFQLPKAWTYSTQEGTDWFKSKYDNGLILISANRHENFMFQTGLPYKDFIYEGSRNYWITSLDNPAKYASWVIYDKNLKGDSVTVFLTKNGHNALTTQYELVYDINGLEIYHRKQFAKPIVQDGTKQESTKYLSKTVVMTQRNR